MRSAIRTFFVEADFLEIDTPCIVPNPGMEPTLDAFAVQARGSCVGWLHTSPELAIKSALAQLDTNIFTLARCFRDDPTGRWHHPEFTMLEWYRIGGSTDDLIADCEGLLRWCADAVGLSHRAAHPTLDAALDLTGHAERRQLREEMVAAVGLDPIASGVDITARAREAGLDVDAHWDRDTTFTVLWADHVEPSLGAPRPTVLEGFSIRDAALARPHPRDPLLADRFELYVAAEAGAFGRGLTGIELANAFGELVDPIVQRKRFEADAETRSARGLTTYPMPEAMLAGLESLGPTSGIALGVERLIVWLAEWRHGWRIEVGELLVGGRRDEAVRS